MGILSFYVSESMPCLRTGRVARRIFRSTRYTSTLILAQHTRI